MTGKPGVLQSMGLQRVGYDLETEQQRRASLHSSVMTIPQSISSLCRTSPKVHLAGRIQSKKSQQRSESLLSMVREENQ